MTEVDRLIDAGGNGIGLQLVSMQYKDLENTIRSAIARNSLCYAVRYREDTHTEYGRLGLFEIGDHRQQPRTSEYDARVKLPLFEAWPMFPNSMLSTEIAASIPSVSSLDTAKPVVGKYADENESDHQYTTALYYNLHQPLPRYLGKQLYRSCHHVVALIEEENEPAIEGSPVIHAVLEVLTQAQQSKNISQCVSLSHFLEYNGAKGGHLKNAHYPNFQIERYRLANLCHRLNIIGKADMVICESSGVAVDAIRAGVPAVFASQVPMGFEGIQQCILDFLQHGDSQRLIAHQTNAFNDVLYERSMQCHVMSGQKSLHALINHRIAELDRLHARYDSKPFVERKFLDPEIWSSEFTAIQQDLIMHTPQSLCVEPDRAVKMKAGIESKRRKFQKFRESPVRFAEDSQIRLLRSLVNNRTP